MGEKDTKLLPSLNWRRFKEDFHPEKETVYSLLSMREGFHTNREGFLWKKSEKDWRIEKDWRRLLSLRVKGILFK